MNNYQDIIKCLPCKTYIMCGTCPYSDKCKYIHDFRIKNIDDKTIRYYNKKKNINNHNYNHNLVIDALFWPYDTSNNGKYYDISKSLIDNNKEYIRIYSIWNNFIDVCKNKNYYSEKIDDKVNKYTNKPRLPVFIKLSL